MDNKEQSSEIISEGTFADLFSLTEHSRIPTKLELDRFMRSLGYHLVPELLSDEALNQVFNNAFDKPVSLDHKPTVDEIFTIRLRAVAQTQLAKDKKVIEGE